WLISQAADDGVDLGNGIEAQKLAQRGQRLRPDQLCVINITLKLQRLQLDLKQVVLADRSGVLAFFADLDRFLVAVEEALGELQIRLCQQGCNEELGSVGKDRALRIRDLRLGHGGRRLGGSKPVLAFLSALEEIADTGVELRILVPVVRVGEQVGLKQGNILRIHREDRVGAQVRGNLLGLVLQNQYLARLQRRVVALCQIERLLEG